jgi:chaperonin GroEL (HSP60 family)
MNSPKGTKILIVNKNLRTKNKDTNNLNICLENNEQNNLHILEEIEVCKTHLIIV